MNRVRTNTFQADLTNDLLVREQPMYTLPPWLWTRPWLYHLLNLAKEDIQTRQSTHGNISRLLIQPPSPNRPTPLYPTLNSSIFNSNPIDSILFPTLTKTLNRCQHLGNLSSGTPKRHRRSSTWGTCRGSAPKRSSLRYASRSGRSSIPSVMSEPIATRRLLNSWVYFHQIVLYLYLWRIRVFII